MVLQKTGKPEVGELVLCMVKRILYHSVFVSIEEYANLEGMVHISEIAPGRIRNLRDYVKEGKRIVCKVLKIDLNTGNIDLSLRRVGTGLRMKKMADYKQEEKAEKLLEYIGKESKLSLQQMYDSLGKQIIQEYGSLHTFFQELVNDASLADDLKIPEALKKNLVKIIQEKISPPEVRLTATLSLTSYREQGIEDVKKILLSMENEDVHVTYLGAPSYHVEVIGGDMKEVDTELRKKCEAAVQAIAKLGGVGSYQKKNG